MIVFVISIMVWIVYYGCLDVALLFALFSLTCCRCVVLLLYVCCTIIVLLTYSCSYHCCARVVLLLYYDCLRIALLSYYDCIRLSDYCINRVVILFCGSMVVSLFVCYGLLIVLIVCPYCIRVVLLFLFL